MDTISVEFIIIAADDANFRAIVDEIFTSVDSGVSHFFISGAIAATEGHYYTESTVGSMGLFIIKDTFFNKVCGRVFYNKAASWAFNKSG